MVLAAIATFNDNGSTINQVQSSGSDNRTCREIERERETISATIEIFFEPAKRIVAMIYVAQSVLDQREGILGTNP